MNTGEKAKRITLFCGHYGSGKTNLAINYALMLKKRFDKVAIADLDIVNPYFRTKDCEGFLHDMGIRLIVSEYANSNVDVPALPAEVYAVTDDKSITCVIDVGGDERGATALGRYSEKIKEENNYEMFFVVNRYRPLTRNPNDTASIMHEIETAADMRFTGLINNSNLGIETEIKTVTDSFEYIKQVEELCGLKLKYTCVPDALYEDCKTLTDNVVPIKLYVKQSWLK